MLIGEALQHPERITDSDLKRVVEVGLITLQRTLTDLGGRILAKEETAFTELKVNMQSLTPVWEFEWITSPPPPSQQSRVFGPASNCADAVAFSMGF